MKQKLKEHDQKYRLNTNSENPFFYKRHIKVDSTELSAEETAKEVVRLLENL